MELLCHMSTTCFIPEVSAKVVANAAIGFYISSNGSNAPVSLLRSLLWFCSYSHPSVCEVINHCWLDFPSLVANHVGYFPWFLVDCVVSLGEMSIQTLCSLFQLDFGVRAVELEEGSSACKFFYPLDAPLGYPEKFMSSFPFYTELPGKRVLVPCRNAPDISFSATF